jgi:hypothetical protein
MPRKPKQHPLDVWRSDNFVYSRGHHDFCVFGAYVFEAEMGAVKNHTLRHRWARACPDGPGNDMVMVFCDGPGRGAFPITEAEV